MAAQEKEPTSQPQQDCQQQMEAVTLSGLEEALRKHKIRQVLGVEHEDDYSVIYWSPVTQRPCDASYILIKYREDGEIYCTDAAYENDEFFYLSPNEGKVINEKIILGWSYYPFDTHD